MNIISTNSTIDRRILAFGFCVFAGLVFGHSGMLQTTIFWVVAYFASVTMAIVLASAHDENETLLVEFWIDGSSKDLLLFIWLCILLAPLLIAWIALRGICAVLYVIGRHILDFLHGEFLG